jgi:magnesium-transporting ATPase (P-type)
MKGADSIVMERLDKTVDQPYIKRFDEKLTEYSVQGLRTLLFAMKVLDESEYEKIMDDLDKIAVMKNAKERRMDYVSEIENGFMAIGMTAVEDKLQDKVPECIANFIESNIKVKILIKMTVRYGCSLAINWKQPRTSGTLAV